MAVEKIKIDFERQTFDRKMVEGAQPAHRFSAEGPSIGATTKMENTKKDFDFDYMAECFERCVHNGTIIIRLYNRGFTEMNKMLTNMGMVFGFAVKELQGRIKNLDEMRHGGDGAHFRKLDEMLRYEVNDVDIVNNKDEWYKSGTRNFLNLHRGLKFFTLFMEGAKEAKPKDNLGPIASKAYDASLARYHSFMLRGVARLAMKSLPNKDGMAQNIYGKDPERIEKMELVGGRAVEGMKKAYNMCKENFKISSRMNTSRSMGP